jgi:hypothetical protein
MAGFKGGSFASPYQTALGYAALHDSATALVCLEKCLAIREPQALYLKVEPLFDALRADSRFMALERPLGLSPWANVELDRKVSQTFTGNVGVNRMLVTLVLWPRRSSSTIQTASRCPASFVRLESL